MPLYYHKDLRTCAAVLSLTHPAWSVLIKELSENKFLTSSDLKRLSGITYRQLNDWEERGYIEPDRDSKEDWRRFSILELIGLVLLKEIRKHGIPISRVKKILEYSRIRSILTERTPEFIKGKDYWLWTDFYKFIWISENPPNRSVPSTTIKNKVSIEGFENSEILIAIPIKRIIDKIIKKLDFDHFKAKINKDGSYSFIVNGVPLILEDMPLEDSTKPHKYLLIGAIPKKIRKQMGLK